MRCEALYLGKNVSQRLIAFRLFMLEFIYLFICSTTLSVAQNMYC